MDNLLLLFMLLFLGYNDNENAIAGLSGAQGMLWESPNMENLV